MSFQFIIQPILMIISHVIWIGDFSTIETYRNYQNKAKNYSLLESKQEVKKSLGYIWFQMDTLNDFPRGLFILNPIVY